MKMKGVTLNRMNAKCHSADCRSAEYHLLSVVMSVVLQRLILINAIVHSVILCIVY
jgi:hypothetical protein